MNVLTQMQKADGRLRACWLGNAGWLLSHNGHLIATDLDLDLPDRALPPFTERDALAAALSVLFITHAHTDHFNPDTVRHLLEGGPCTLVLPESCRVAAERYGLPAERIVYVLPTRLPLDEQNNPLPVPMALDAVPGLPDWLRAETLRALHGHLGGAVYGGANPQDCGYVFTLGGYRIVQPGDTVLLQEHLQLADIDLLLVSPTEHNMGVAGAARFLEAVQPRNALAQHFGTYHEDATNAFWTHGYVDELGEALPEALRPRYAIPQYATPITL